MSELRMARLIRKLRRDFSAFTAPDDAVWLQPPAAKIIDCVLSLRMNYARVVEPRVKRFISEHGEVRSCEALRGLIASYKTPAEFLKEVLSVRHASKGEAMLRVAEYLMEAQQRFAEGSEEQRLTAWAKWARPGDYLALEAPGFKLAGFQYLRMLFGGGDCEA